MSRPRGRPTRCDLECRLGFENWLITDMKKKKKKRLYVYGGVCGARMWND